MSRFSERLERDLTQIADRASPSSTAWDTIRQRMSVPEHETETEIIMLSPERSNPAHHRRTWLLAGAAALVTILVIGLAVAPRSADEEEPAATQVPTPTTLQPVPDPPEYLGIVWENSTNPERVNTSEGRPEIVNGPFSARVDMFLTTPGPDESQFCAEAADEGKTGPGGQERVLPEITSCLIVEWEFDVGEEAANNAGMDARDTVDADGEPVEPLVYDFPMAPPGGSASGSVVYPNLGPGARIPLGYEVVLPDGGIIFERWEVVVPDAFQPIDWFENER